MRRNIMKKLIVASALSISIFGFTSLAQSTIITYNLDYEFSGGAEPQGPAPWLTVTFDDNGGSGSVEMTLTSHLIDDEFIQSGGLYLNFDPNLDATALGFSYVSGYTGIEDILLGTNNYKADGDGFFDIEMVFDNAPPSDRFGAGDSLVYNITLDGITASSFAFASVNGPVGKTGFHAAAHIASIGEGGDSGWIGDRGGTTPVPEPATILLFGTGLAGLAGIARRKRN